MRALRVTGLVSVDGVLDEPVWAEAEPVTDFVQSKPNTGYPASERTVVRVLYDDQNLYIGAVLYERDPRDITVYSLRRDFPTGEGDVFGIALDTYLDRRNGFLFGINPRGGFADLQAFDNGRDINFSWEGVVNRAVRVHEEGWTVEVAIPFTTLRFDATTDQPWGLNFLRRIRRRNEDSFWAPMDRRFSLNRMTEAGTLTGLSGMRSGLNLMVKPYILSERASGEVLTGGEGVTDVDAGFDVKYGVSRRLTLDLTYLTDFSQVEVDEEQVNLTRFSLFFPEKREFFVENSGLFDFGDVPERGYRLGASLQDFKLFHSRRIGLEGGRPVPVLGGGRLTGRVGDWGVGILNMQTRGAEDLPAENFTAVRLRRTVFGSVQLGGILLNREVTDDAPGGGFNRSFGADLYARLFGKMVVQSYLAGTRDGGDGGNNRAARISVAFRDRFWNTSIMFREMGDAFNPEMGFVRRRGIRHSYATVGVHHQRASGLLNELNPFVEVDYITNLESVLETRTGTAGLITTMLDGSRLTLEYSDRFEQLFEPFRVLGEQEVGVGSYDFKEVSADFQSSTGRVVSAGMRLSSGGYFGGTRRSAQLGGQWKPNYHISFDLNAQYNRIDLGGDPFTAEVYRGRVEYAYSNNLFGSGLVQYNGATDEMIMNLRLDFIHSPLSDLFLVYTERRDVGEDTVLDRQFTAKLTKLWSF